MAIDAADWEVTRSTGNIRYIGDDHGGASPTYATVIEFHRWLAGLADDASSTGDDEVDITDANPSDRSTDNIITLLGTYNIDDTAAEHLYDGSIIQGTGGTEVIYDGIVNFGNSDVQIQIIQDGAVLTDDWWNFGGGGLNADAANGISHRFMLKVRTAGADIDGRRIIGTTRTFGNTYGEFKINGTSRGNNVLALVDSTDLNNSTVVGTVATWTTIDNTTEGYINLDINGDSTDEYYYSQWNRDTYSINQFYERMKWLTRDGSSSTLYGLNGEVFRGITHEIDVDGATGTFAGAEELQWDSGNSSGQLLAIDSTTAATKIWIQLLTGVIPGDNDVMTGQTSAATVTAELSGGSVTERTISTPFIGASTGSALIGAYGVGMETADTSAADTFFDLTNTSRNPPNNVTFTVSGLVSGEDRVLVAQNNAGDIDYDQFSLNTTLSGAGETAVVLTTTIPTDTPSTGTIRIQNDEGLYRRVAFTSWSGSTFTIASTAFNGSGETDSATAGNNVFISYIDETASGTSASFTGVYDTDRTLFVRVRDGAGTPIKPFETTGTLGSNGGSATAIRTSDA